MDKQYDVVFEYSGMNCFKVCIEVKICVEFKYNMEEDLLGIINEYGYVYCFELDNCCNVIIELGFDGLIWCYECDVVGQVVVVV